MGVSKVVYDNVTLIDLSNDTVTSGTLARGHTAHSADGNIVVGTMDPGWPPFNAALIAPPYCTVHGVAYRTGEPDEPVSFEMGSETTALITVTPNTRYELHCDVDIPYQTTTKKYRVFSKTFYTQDEIEDLQFRMIPGEAIFWYGWENPDWLRQTTYYTGGNDAVVVHKASSDGTGNNISASQVDLMTLDKQKHCYKSDMYLTTASHFHILGYENLFQLSDAARYINCLSDFYWPNETGTSTDAFCRYDYGYNNNHEKVSATYPNGFSRFWASATNVSGNHMNVTYNQFRSHTVPSGQTYAKFVENDLLRVEGFIDKAGTSLSLPDARFSTRLRINHVPRAEGSYYNIYAITMSNDRLLWPEEI